MALYDTMKNLIAGATLFADTPLGTINAFGGSVAPDGWLMCQGQAVSRATYADLFAVVGTAFGAGDGSTTFNIPDFRGEFLRGAGTNSHSGQGNGGSVGEHQDGTEIPGVYVNNYSKIGMYPVNTSGSDYNLLANKVDKVAQNSAAYIETMDISKGIHTDSIGLYTARPTNTSVNFIIKAKQVGIPQDFLTQLEELLDSKQLLSWGNGT